MAAATGRQPPGKTYEAKTMTIVLLFEVNVLEQRAK